MAPSATGFSTPPLPIREEKTYPPARIFNVKETKFEKYVTPHSDGRDKAHAMPEGSAAIVIDNGWFIPLSTLLALKTGLT